MHGVLQPILVRRVDNNYFLVSGERRIKASRVAGVSEIPAVIRIMTDAEAAAATLVENLQREDVSFLDEAAGYRKLNIDFNLTQNEIAKLVGKSQPYVANKIRILNLPKTVREIISREIMVTERHCRALLRLSDEESQLKLLDEIIQKSLSTQATDEIVEKIVNQTDVKKSKQYKVMVIKDIRIFLNSIRTAIKALHDTGIEAEWEQNENDDSYLFSIKIMKQKRNS